MPKNPDEYLNINQRAQKTFAELKQKMKLDMGLPLIEQAIFEGSGKHIKVDRQKIEDLLEGKIDNIPELEPYQKQQRKDLPAFKELDKVGESINNIFEWIDSLELDPKLSLAIGLIISYNNTKNYIDLAKAIGALKEFSGTSANENPNPYE